MKKIFSALVLVLVSVFLFPLSTHASRNEIIFVVSSNTLEHAIQNKDKVKGVALSLTFYANASLETQARAKELLDYLSSRRLRPLFLFGLPFDMDRAKTLIDVRDEDMGVLGCAPEHVKWLGVFPTHNKITGTPITAVMCAQGAFRTERQLMRWIDHEWPLRKLYIERGGFAVLEWR